MTARTKMQAHDGANQQADPVPQPANENGSSSTASWFAL
jgi:hypothetical protein